HHERRSRPVGQLRTGSLESLRERNRLRVIDALRTRGAISRADIARQTGLSRSTVASLGGDLQASGLAVLRAAASRPPSPPRGGRPGPPPRRRPGVSGGGSARRSSSLSTNPPAPSS